MRLARCIPARDHIEEKREPVSDIDIAVADSLKVLDLKRPIREATEIARRCNMSRRTFRLMHRSKWLPHSISSSARARSVGGISRLSALAAFQIDDQLEFVGPVDRDVARLGPVEDLVHINSKSFGKLPELISPPEST